MKKFNIEAEGIDGSLFEAYSIEWRFIKHIFHSEYWFIKELNEVK